MPSKKHTPEEIIGKLREAEIAIAQGVTTPAACRRIAVSEQTYYRWRKEYGGLKVDQPRPHEGSGARECQAEEAGCRPRARQGDP